MAASGQPGALKTLTGFEAHTIISVVYHGILDDNGITAVYIPSVRVNGSMR